MASIYKRNKKKNEPYTIQYFDHRGRRRTKIGFTDKGLTEELSWFTGNWNSCRLVLAS